MFQDILIRPHPPGQYTAQVVGIPEIRVEAASPQEAIDRLRELMSEWFKDAKMVRVNVPMDNRLYPSEDFPPKPRDPNDPMEREYLEELARMRREDRPDMAGHAKDDPLFDEYLEEITRARREM